MTDILHEFLSLSEGNADVFASDKCLEHKLQKLLKTNCRSHAQSDHSVRLTALEANCVSHSATVVTVRTFVSFQCT